MVLGEVENNAEEECPPTVELKKDPELTADQESRINQYLELSENNDEEDMERLLGSQLGNHFWTQKEKTCLVYFVQKVDGDYEALHENYFTHRSAVALKVQYKKILKGNDTPATTPRLSISNITRNAGNSLVKLLTPKASPMKEVAQPLEPMETIEEEEPVLEEEEDAKLLAELEQEEEENIVEKNEEVEEEQEEAPMETEEQADTKKTESLSWIMVIFIPILLLVVAHIFIIMVPEDALSPAVESSIKLYKQTWIDTFSNFKN